MRVVTWNVHRATKLSKVWEVIAELSPDIALLQEVISIPDRINEEYASVCRLAINKIGNKQRFHTCVLVKGKISEEFDLTSALEWVNVELKQFHGNFVSCVVKPQGYPELHVV